jgi:hypothetical protein
MRKFEEVCGEKVFEGEQELEDITEELFSTLGELKGCQMLCKEDMDLYDSMSAFEVNCPKMDVRYHRKSILTPTKAIAEGKMIIHG